MLVKHTIPVKDAVAPSGVKIDLSMKVEIKPRT
jgi:hypothetical protein